MIETFNDWKLIAGDPCIGKWVKETGRLDHDQNMLPYVLPLIPDSGTVVDAGAFIGDHTIAYLKAVGPAGHVHAFEPNSEAYECLTHNCPSAHCHRAALGSTVRRDRFVLDKNNVGASSLTKEPIGGSALVIPLDSLNLHRLDFFKIDVEGMEADVLSGAANTILKHRPAILLEINPYALKARGSSREEVFKLLTNLRYKWSNVYPEQSADVPDGQIDILALPP